MNRMCVLNSSIFDLFNDHQILSRSQKKSLVCSTGEYSAVCAFLTINLFLFLLNVLRLSLSSEDNEGREQKKSLPLKSEQKTKEQTQCWKHLWDCFSRSLAKYAFCLRPKHSFSFAHPICFYQKRKNLTSELCCQRINDSQNEDKRVKFLSGKSKGETYNFQKVLIYFKGEENVLFPCKCIIKCKQMISNANQTTNLKTFEELCNLKRVEAKVYT